MLFEGNEAEVGPIMYASSFTACTWFSETSPFFNADLQEGWTFMDIEDNYLLRGNRRSLRPDYYFQTSVRDILFVDPPENVSAALVCMLFMLHNIAPVNIAKCTLFDHRKSFIEYTPTLFTVRITWRNY